MNKSSQQILNDLIDADIEACLFGSLCKVAEPTVFTIESIDAMKKTMHEMKNIPIPPIIIVEKTDGSFRRIADNMIGIGRALESGEELTNVKNVYLINPDRVGLNAFKLDWNFDWSHDRITEPEEPAVKEPHVTFKQFARNNWKDYLRTVLPAAVVFFIAAFVTKTSLAFYVASPLALAFLAGLTVLQQYNRWYPYYGPNGLLNRGK